MRGAPRTPSPALPGTQLVLLKGAHSPSHQTKRAAAAMCCGMAGALALVAGTPRHGWAPMSPPAPMHN